MGDSMDIDEDAPAPIPVANPVSLLEDPDPDLGPLVGFFQVLLLPV